MKQNQLSVIIYVNQSNYRSLNLTLKQLPVSNLIQYLIIADGIDQNLELLIDHHQDHQIQAFQFPLIGFAKAINQVLKQVDSQYLYFWPLGKTLNFNLLPILKLALTLDANILMVANPKTLQKHWAKITLINVDQDFANHPQLATLNDCFFKTDLHLQFDERYFITNFSLFLTSFCQNHPERIYFYNRKISSNQIHNWHRLSHWEFNWHYWQLIDFAKTTKLNTKVTINQFVDQLKWLWKWTKKDHHQLDHHHTKMAFKVCFNHQIKPSVHRIWWKFFQSYFRILL